MGRHAERAALGTWLDDATAGTPGVVLVSGPPGIGKSTLAEWLLDHARSRGLAAAAGRATRQEGAPAFWPWRQILSGLGGPELLGATGAEDSPGDRFLRFQAVVGWLLDCAGAAGTGPGALVVLDDMHWADQPSLRLLTHLASGLRDQPVLVLAALRADPADHVEGVATVLEELGRLPVVHRLELAGLDAQAVADLLGPVDPPTVEWVLPATGGNALFVREMARHLHGGGDRASVPASIREAVAARIGARTAACAGVLRSAAVAGQEFSVGVLATATGRPAIEVLGLLGEADAAGLVTPGGEPGRYRFRHALVRDAVEATVDPATLACLHRDVALAIEAFDGTGDDRVADIARHWECSAALGDRARAATWNERAAEAAARLLAWEEAARLYDRSLALGGPGIDPLDRHRRLMGAARNRLHTDELDAVLDRCEAALDAARQAGRSDLMTEAALVAEARAGNRPTDFPRLRDLALQALDAVADGDHSARGRLLGQLATISVYLEPGESDQLSRAALAEADLAGDPRTDVSAARARQMVRLSPEHAEERLALAGRIGTAGRRLRRADVVVWESLWSIDSYLELGRAPEAVAVLAVLRDQVAACPYPMLRWHLARTEAALATVAGRWEEAEARGWEARRLFAAHEGEEGAISMQFALRSAIGAQIGYAPDVLDDYDRVDLAHAPAWLGDIPRLAPIDALVATGRRDEAEARYAGLVSVRRWQPPAFLDLALPALRLVAALALGHLDEVALLLERLEPYRGLHVAGGGGPVAYLGPVECSLGEGALALGRWDQAVECFRRAASSAVGAGSPPFQVRSTVGLVAALASRGGAADRVEAAALAAAVRPQAVALGMAPWLARLDAAAPPGPDDAGAGGAVTLDGRGPLSPRELEVAGLVARGLTNKDIAARLYLSQRTAQNHVQHILTKLGVSNRTQIATWFHNR